MRLVLGLAVVVVVASGCSPPSERTARTERTEAESGGRATGVADGVASPAAAEPDARDAAIAGETAGPEDQAREAVIAAREAAREAQIESMGPPEADPRNPALEETHSGTELVRVISETELLWMNEEVARYLPRSSLDVQSVTLPEDGVAWLETCIVSDREAVANRTGNVLELGSFTTTQQRTEVMRKDDGSWRLVGSYVNSSEDGVAGCATASAEGRPADGSRTKEDIVNARETAEQAWIDAITGVGVAEPSDSYTGYLLDLFIDPRNARFVRMHCPWLPSDEELWPEDDLRIYDGEAGRTPEDCLRRLHRSHLEGKVVHRSRGAPFGGGSTSRVVVESVVLQETGSPEVAYLRTCREHDLIRPDGGGEMLYFVGKATIRSTEAMRLDDGAWKLAARWDFTVEEDTAAPCR